HGQKSLGLPPFAQLPRRHRGRHLLLQARLWRRPLHLARAQTLQGLHLVSRGRPQPGAVRPPQTGVATLARPKVAAISKITPTGTARSASRVSVATIRTGKERETPVSRRAALPLVLSTPLKKKAFMEAHWVQAWIGLGADTPMRVSWRS